MKNQDNDPIFCGKIVSVSPVVIEVDVISSHEDVEDNINTLNDFGYHNVIQESIKETENIKFSMDDLGFPEFISIDYCLNRELAFEHLEFFKNIDSRSEEENQIYEFLKIRCEFMGIITDGRKV